VELPRSNLHIVMLGIDMLISNILVSDISQRYSACSSSRLESYRLCRCVCSDDKHSDCQSERRRHVRVFVHAVYDCFRGGRHSFVTQQHVGPVRLPHLENKRAALDFYDGVDLRNCYHFNRALHRCHLSYLVQGRNEKPNYYKCTWFLDPTRVGLQGF